MRSENLTKDKILLTAAELFAEVGYENASMRLIAERCQITKPALYYYFSDKKNLFLEIITSCQKYSQEAVEQIVNSDLPPVEKLKSIVTQRFTSLKQHPAIARFFNVVLSGNIPSDIYSRITVEIQNYVALIRQVIAEGRKKGDFRSDFDEFSFIAALIGGMNVFIVRYLKDGVDFLTPEKAQQFIETLVKGISKEE